MYKKYSVFFLLNICYVTCENVPYGRTIRVILDQLFWDKLHM